MSLSVAINAAVSSLDTLSTQMAVASNNISNANTTGYSDEEVTVTSNTSAGYGTGVSNLGTFSNVDQFLLTSVIQSNMVNQKNSAISDLYQKLQQSLGQITTATSGGNDLSSQITTFQTSLSTLAANPGNSGEPTNLVNSLNNITNTFQSLTSQIQSLRNNAETQINLAVNDINVQLKTIQTLNYQIASTLASKQNAAGMLDQRNTALQKLNGNLNVSSYIDSNGIMTVYASNNQPLLVGNHVNLLQFNPTQVTPTTSPENGNIGTIMAGSSDITTAITGGTIAGLVTMRDVELPNAQNTLNYMAQKFSQTVNSSYSNGISYPPPSLSNGALTSPSGYSFSASSPVTIAANTKIMIDTMDSSGLTGSTASQQAKNSIIVSLNTSDTTLQDVINDINNTSNINVTASLSSTGQLTLTPKSGSSINQYAIGITTLSGGMTPGTAATSNSTNKPLNFNAYFHLNDLINNGFSAQGISVNPDIMKYPSSFSSVTLGTTGAAINDGSNATNLFNALTNDFQFLANSATSTSAFSGTNSALGISGSFTISGGLSSVQIAITTSNTLSDIVSTINSSNSGITASIVGTGGQYQLHIETNGDTINFKNELGTNALGPLGLSSAPSGYIAKINTNFSSYAQNFITDVTSRAQDATSKLTVSQTQLTTLQNNLSSQSGVDVNTQMANITTYQNLYAASAKVISVAQTMFASLISAVQSA